MLKTLLLFSLSFLFTQYLHAQTSGSISGKLIDSVGKQSLKFASIKIIDQADTTVEILGLSKDGGSFMMAHVPFGQYEVLFSFQGYHLVTRRFSLTKEHPLYDFGNIYMKLAPKDLDEVVVQQSPMIIKKDTLEYNAGSYKTKPNAVVEDLLKKLPGVLVDKDGNVNAQGEQVQRIFVDGKRFFGNDPKMATKNLPPDIVDKIQIYDAMSDQSAFSGFDDGTRIKTINITTKKNKKKGLFGKAIAAAGDQGHYEGNINFSRFKNDQKITLLAQANNINIQGFTATDGGGSGRSRAGITETKATGLNFTDVWGKHCDVSGSYFFNKLNTNRDSRSFTERYIPNSDTSYFSYNTNNSDRNNFNHRLNLNIEQSFDSANMLIIRPDISFSKSDNLNETFANTLKGKEADNIRIFQNYLLQNTSSGSKGVSGDVNLTFRHRFKAKGHTFSVSLSGNLNNNENSGNNYALTHYFVPQDSIKLANQINHQVAISNGISSNISYTIPIVENHVLQLSYGYHTNHNTSTKTTYAFDSITQQYDNTVDSLSNVFFNQNSSNRFTLGYRFKTEHVNFNIANGIQYANLRSDNDSKGTHFNRNFHNFYPTASYMYTYSKKHSIRINYSGRTSQPSISNLQPVPNNSNQANIITGNPNLGQEFAHNLRFLYTFVNPDNFRNISILANGGLVQKKVVNSTTQLANGYQTTTYVNQNGSFNLRANVNYGFQLHRPKSNLNFITNTSFNRDVNLINAAINYTNNTQLSEAINWTMNLNEKLDLNLNTSYAYNIIRYSIKPQNNKDYYSTSFSIEPSYTFNGGWVLGSDFDYFYNSGLTAGYNANLPLWNASFAKQLFNKKQGELKISVFDLLNQNKSISRNATSNYVQDVQNNVLQRYFLLTFTYNLRKFPGSQQKRSSKGKDDFSNQDFKGGGRQGRKH